MGYTLECCVDSVESAIAAKKGGADRIELCSALVIGGLSPSQALYRKIREQVDIQIRVLLRPRFGDFCYTDFEQEILKEEFCQSWCRWNRYWSYETRWDIESGADEGVYRGSQGDAGYLTSGI